MTPLARYALRDDILHTFLIHRPSWSEWWKLVSSTVFSYRSYHKIYRKIKIGRSAVGTFYCRYTKYLIPFAIAWITGYILESVGFCIRGLCLIDLIVSIMQVIDICPFEAYPYYLYKETYERKWFRAHISIRGLHFWGDSCMYATKEA
jgi:hypothetical protein